MYLIVNKGFAFLEAVSLIFDRSIRVKFTISFKISVLKEVGVL